jgi:L-fucose isomerase-like protein
MKARLLPLYFKNGWDSEFDDQVARLKNMLINEAEILEPVMLGSTIPEADAVFFPQLVGQAYREIEYIREIKTPILAITSEFGTVSMWDWEIITFLKSAGIETYAPYTIEQTKTICRALVAIKGLKGAKFIVFQDNPGDGMQASIFKRFYWWEDDWIRRVKDRFGIDIVKKSYKNLGEQAKQVSDAEAKRVLREWEFNKDSVNDNSLNSAIKLYIVLKAEIEADKSIKGAGINCLNESFYSDTTPCLAWNMLFEEKGLIWGCEADTLSMLTMYIIYNSLKAPVFMSNLYPFLMGMAALKHEKINEFPKVEDPERHILVAHCGYFGCLPKKFSTEWTLRPKVLEIVDENAIALDARLPVGNTTIVQLHPTLRKILVVNGVIDGYVQYPGSDCRNGALIKVDDGHSLMNSLYSHHGCIIMGNKRVEMELVARIINISTEFI